MLTSPMLKSILTVFHSDVSGTSFNATDLTAETSYTLSTRTVDLSGNVNSSWVNLSSTTTADVTAPSSVTGLGADPGETWINWSWTNPSDVDFSHVEVYLDGIFQSDISGTSFNSTGLTAETIYTLSTRTVDLSGNVNSSWVNLSSTTTADVTAPSSVTGLGSTPGETWINWSWTNPLDVDFSHVEVYLDGVYQSDISGTSFNATDLTAETSYTLSTLTVDLSGNVNSSWVNLSSTTTADVTAPSSVTGLGSTPGETWINWSWSNPSDSDFSHVEVYLDGIFQSDISGTSFNSTGLTAETSYTLSTRTVDLSGNVNSSWVNLSSTTTADVTAPSSVTGLGADPGETWINWSWSNPVDVDFSHVEVYLDGVFQSDVSGTSFNATDLTAETIYTLSTRTVDLSDNVNSSWVNLTSSTTADVTAPSSVTGLGSTPGETWINWSWTNPSDVDFSHVEVYLDGIFHSDISGTNFNSTGLTAETIYTLSTRTVDLSGNVNSSWVNLSSTTTADVTAPSSVTGLGSTPGETWINWSWSNPSDVDFSHVEVYLDGVFQSDISGTNFNSTDLTAETIYTLSTRTVDLSGNVNSSWVNLSSTTTADVTAPSSVAGLGANPGETWINWSWTNPVDVDFSHVEVYLDGVFQSDISGTSFNATDLTAETSYTLSTLTVDLSGNVNSSWVNLTSSTTADVTAPSSVTGLGSTPGETWINWSWTNPSDVDFSHVEVYLDGIFHSDISGTNFNSTGLTAETIYTLSTRTVDLSGNVNSSWVNLSSTTTADVTAPSSVTGLGSTPGETWINWSWSNPSDVDFSRVEVYLDGVFQSDISGTNFNSTDLTAETIYTLSTRTVDLSGNVNSSWVNLSSTTTADVTAPSSVAGLGANPGETWINWSWTNPSDVDFSHVEVYLDGIFQSDISGTSFNATDLTAETSYTLSTRTVDLSDNVNSSWVNLTSSTTADVTAPSSVTGLGSTPGETWINWSWTNPSDVDFSHVEVYLDGIFQSDISGTSFNSTDLTAETSYTLSTRTVDLSGNVNSSWVNLSSTTTADVTAPSSVTSLGADPGETRINWSWTNPVDVDFSHVEVYLDGIFQSDISGTKFNATDLTAETIYTLSTRTVDLSGNVNSSWVNLSSTTTADVTAPSSVTGLSANPGETWIEWSWTNPVDSDFSYVEVYLDGIFQSDVSGTSFNATDLTAETIYTLSTRTVDLSGNVNSSWVNLSSTTTADVTAPSSVTGLGSTPGETWINWSWTNPSDVDFSHVEVYLDGIFQSDISGTSFNATDLTAETSYTLSTRTVDLSDNVNSSWVNLTSSTTADVTAPSSVTGLGSTPGETWINWSWTNPLDVDFSHVEVYLDGVYQSDISGTNFNATDLAAETSYTLSTRTVDLSGNINFSWVNLSSTTTADVTASSSVTGLGSTPGETWINWSWSNPSDVDFSHVEVYLDGIFQSDVSGTSFNATGLTAETSYTLSTRTVDLSGNVNSSWVNSTSSTTNDVTAPSSITVLVANPGETWIEWNWFNPVDADFSHVEVYLDGIFQSDVSGTSFNATGLTAETSYTLSTRTVDLSGNVNSSWVNSTSSTTADVTAPSSVTGLSANPGETWIEWNWFNPVDADFSHVEVYLDGIFQSDVSGTSFNATGLIAETSYTLSTRTVDLSGNVNSSWVNSTSITTNDVTAPSSVTGLGSTPGETWINWSWTNPSDVDFSHVEVYLDGIFQSDISGTSFNATDLIAETSYTLSTRTVDLSGNVNSSWINSTSITTNDVTAPSSVTGLSADPGETWINWSWTNPSDVDFSHVEVYLDGVFQSDVSGTSFNATGLTAETSYTLSTRTVDLSGNVNSSWVNSTSITTNDVTAPSSVTGLGSTPGETWINWSWTNPSDVDFSHVEVYLDGIFQSDISGTSFNATDLIAETSYTLSTRTVDLSGNVNSSWVNSTSITTNDVTAPSSVTGLSADPGETWINWSWTNPSDVDFSHVEVYLDGVFQSDVSGTSFNATGLTAETSYTLSTRTVDLSGNVNSSWVNSTSSTTNDVTAPSSVTGLSADPGETWINWSWTNPVDVDFSHVEVYLDGIFQSDISGTSFNATGLTAETSYTLSTRTVDLSGNVNSSWVNSTSSTTNDVTAPSSVTGLSANPGETWIEWNWANPVDVDFSHVEVYLDGVFQSDVSDTSFNATGLTAETSYTLSTRTVDLSGNVNSSWVNSTSSTTNDVTAPSSVTGLSANPGETWIEWNWANPVDVDFSHVEVYLDGIFQSDVSGTSFNATGLTAETSYTLSTRTVDLSGNVNSSWVNSTSSTTNDVTAPSSVTGLSANPGETWIEWNWANPVDVDFSHVEVYLDGVFQSDVSDTSFNATGLTAETSYTLSTRTVDLSGNVNSSWVNSTSSTTNDVTAPSSVTGLSADPGETWINWSWTNPVDVDFSHVEVYLDGIFQSDISGTSFNATGLTAETSYTLSTRTVDLSGNVNTSWVNSTSITTNDVTAPSSVTGLSANPGETWIEWNWANPVDVDFSHVEVYLDGVFQSDVSDTSFNATGLTAETSYTLSTRTVDLSGNVNSSWVNSTSSTTNDVTAPSSVTGLSADPGETWINWSWTNPSDVDFSHVEVYLDGIFQSDISGTSFNATGLTAETSYTLSTRTVDLSGNVNSSWVNSTSSTTNDVTAPSSVTGLSADPGETWINWSWTNPVDVDFSHVEVYLDGIFQSDISGTSFNATGLTAETSYTLSTRTVDLSGNVNTSWVNSTSITTNDVTAPSSVTGLSANPGETWIEWNWANPVDVDFSHVEVYLDGVFQSDVSDTSFNATGLTAETSYTLSTRTVDLSGNVNSSWVNSTSSTTNDVTAPSSVTGLSANPGETWIEWNWANPVDVDFSHVEVYLDGIFQSDISGTSFNGTDLTAETSYTLSTRTVDLSGNVNSSWVNSTSSTTNDVTAPSSVTGLSANPGETWIVWNWFNPVDADFSHVEVYLDGVFQSDVSGTSFNATDLTAETSYTLSTRTVDLSGNVNSSWVNLSSTTTADVTAPSSVTGLSANPGETWINWSWTNPSDVDFSHVEVYLDGVFQTDVSGTSFNATGLTAETSYTLSTRTVDLSGNVNSSWVNSTSSTTNDVTAPSSITVLSANPGETWIEWNWFNPVDADFSHVEVYLDGVFQTDVSGTSFNATDLTAETSYTLSTRTVDLSGNVNSSWVNSTSSTTNDVTAPSSVTGLSADPGETWINWSWTNPVDVDFSHVEVYLDGIFQSDISGTSFNATGLTAETSYTLSTRTVDLSGNVNTSWVNSTSITTNDVTAPSSVTGLSANPGETWIEWNWANPVDVDFSHVEVYLDGVFQSDVSDTSFNATGLTAETSYTLSTRTVDLSGNVNSSWVNSTSSTTNDVTAPSSVTGLSANPGETWIEWNWANPVDVDFSHVEVYLDGIFQSDISGTSFNGTDLTAETSYTLSTRTVDLSGNVNSSWVNLSSTTTADVTAPSSVTGLGSTPGETWINWSWTNPVDVDFSHVEVYLDGIFQSDISGTSFNGTDLTAETSYTLSTRTVDLSGNVNSSWVNSTSSTTNDVTAPSSVTGLSANPGETWIVWNWFNPVDADFSHVEVYLDGVFQSDVSGTSFNATDLTAETSYTLSTRTVDLSGNVNSSWVNLSSTTTADVTAPSSVTGLSANPGETWINWSWTNPSDVDFSHVEVYLDGIFQSDISGTSFNATDLTAETIYTLSTRTVDLSGNVNSSWLNSTSSTTNDVTAPSSVTGLGSTPGETWINWSWTNPLDADFSHVEVYLDGVFQSDISGTSFNATDLTAETSYTLSTRTVDLSGNVNSSWVNSTSSTTNDVTAPSSVTGLGSTPGETWINWSWTNPSDVDFSHVEVYLDGIFQSDISGTSFNATDLTAETIYTLSTRTVDLSDNVNSSWVNSTSSTTNDVTAPSSVTGLGSTPGETWINWSWTNPLDADFSHVEVYLDGVFQSDISGTSFNATGLTAETSYTLSTRSVDLSGNVNSSWVNLSSTTTADVTAPSSVTGLSATPGETWINWSWANPVDPDFSHVEVYLDGVFQSDVSGTSFNATGLTAETSYTLSTRSVDLSDNVNSSWVNLSSTTTADVTPPSSVTGLSATPGETWINWSWTNPVDPDFSHVEVYLDGVFQSDISGTSFNATGLTAETSYTLSTRSVDLSGNLNSSWVNSTSSTTNDVTPPSSVTGLSATPGETWINWSWTNPVDPDFSHVEVYLGGVFQSDISGTSFNATGLTAETSYTLSTRSVDLSGNLNSSWVNSTSSTTNDVTPPSSVTGLASISGETWINWSWINPADPDFSHVKVYLDGIFQEDVSNATFNTTGLVRGTAYDLSIATVDFAGNVNNTLITLEATTKNPAIADFTSNVTSGKEPMVVQFIDNSTAPLTWSWNFGDGNTSTEQNPVHLYAESGKYHVSLTVTNNDGVNTTIKRNYIIVVERIPPVANFTVDKITGKEPLSVQFTDLSINALIWSWDFGDGIYSSLIDPVHTYDEPGVYNVSLTVTNDDGYDTLTYTEYITVIALEPPVAAFIADVTSGERPLIVRFTDQSTNATSWKWDVNGDGIFDYFNQNPSHRYNESGNYNITLYVSNAKYNDSITKTSYIKVSEPFTASTSSGGGGGGGQATGEEYENILFKDVAVRFVAKDVEQNFVFNSDQNVLRNVTISANRNLGEVKAIIEVLKGPSTLVPVPPEGNVYTNLNIWVGDAYMKPYVTSSSLAFSVERVWLTANNAPDDSIKMAIYLNGQWYSLPTQKVSEDEDNVYYESQSPGELFGSFAITSHQSTPSPSPSITESPVETARAPSFSTADTEPVNVTYVPGSASRSNTAMILGAGSLAILLLAGGLFLAFKKGYLSRAGEMLTEFAAGFLEETEETSGPEAEELQEKIKDLEEAGLISGMEKENR